MKEEEEEEEEKKKKKKKKKIIGCWVIIEIFVLVFAIVLLSLALLPMVLTINWA